MNGLSVSTLGRLRRRSVLAAGVAGAGMLAGAGLAGRAAHAAPVTTMRGLGRTGEQLPAIGLGVTMGVDRRPEVRRANLRAVLQAYWAAGGRVIDTSRLYSADAGLFSEVTTALGIAGELFLTQRLWTTPEDRQLHASQARLRRDRMDALQVGDLADVEAFVPLLGQWKDAGRVRYVGVSHHETRYYPAIEILMRNADIDVIQIRYSILTRHAEEHLLPLAAERGIPVLAGMPLENRRLHRLVAGHQVPGWAAQFGATTWAQFFLKYVLAHPAVTVVLPSASNPAHVAENMAALRGPLPDDDQRARMVEHLAGLPGFAQAGA